MINEEFLLSEQEKIHFMLDSQPTDVLKTTLQYLEAEVRKGNKVKPSLRREQELSTMYVQIAEIKLAFKQPQAAVEAYSKAITLNQKNFDAFYGRAKMRKEAKEFNKAKEDYQHCIALAPKRTDLFIFLGMCQYYSQEYQPALLSFNQYIKFFPQDPLSYFYRGDIQKKLKQYALAIPDFEKAIDLQHPLSALIYTFLGYAKQRLSRLDEALAHYNAAINLEPKNAEFFSDRAACRISLKDYHHALMDYKKSFELNPKAFHAVLGTGRCYHYLGEYDKAIEHFNQLMSCDHVAEMALKYRTESENAVALKKKELKAQNTDPLEAVSKILREKKATERNKRLLEKARILSKETSLKNKILEKAIKAKEKKALEQQRKNLEQNKKIGELTKELIAKTQAIDTLQKEGEAQTKAQTATIKTLEAEIERLKKINVSEKTSERTQSNHPAVTNANAAAYCPPQVYSQEPQWLPQFHAYQQGIYQQPAPSFQQPMYFPQGIHQAHQAHVDFYGPRQYAYNEAPYYMPYAMPYSPANFF